MLHIICLVRMMYYNDHTYNIEIINITWHIVVGIAHGSLTTTVDQTMKSIDLQ